MSKPGRKANYELLRIIAMLMVVTMHYLNHTGALLTLGESADAKRLIGTLLEAFCIVAVNVYVLISGYFLVESGFKVKRILVLICQILFYAIIIPLIMMGTGMFRGNDTEGFYRLLQYIFPIGTEHYWFATSYVLLYFFSPILNIAVKNMTKKQFTITLSGLLILFCGIKSLVPFQFVTDRFGYDFGWFICVYLTAAYIRLYGIPILSKRKNAWITYVLCSMLIFGIVCTAFYLNTRTGILAYYFTVPFHYNYILCFIGAIALFYAFSKIKIPRGKTADIICRLSPYTFGVYLFHEHIDIRNEWAEWTYDMLGSIPDRGIIGFIIHLLTSVILVYIAGTFIDGIRKIIFDFVGKYLEKTKISLLINKADEAFTQK